MLAPDVVGVGTDRLLHPQRRVASAQGVVLVGERRAEQRHDAVPEDLVHRPFVAVHRLHHDVQRRVEQGARLFRVAPVQELERSPDIGEQHGHVLALALQAAPGRQDLLGEELRRIGVGSGEPRRSGPLAPDLGAALETEPGTGRQLAAAGGALQAQARPAAEAVPRRRRVILLADRTLHVRPPLSMRIAKPGSPPAGRFPSRRHTVVGTMCCSTAGRFVPQTDLPVADPGKRRSYPVSNNIWLTN